MRGGASVEGTWITWEVVCFLIRPWEEGAGVNHGDASGQVHIIGNGFLEEGRTGGEDGDRDPIYEKGV